MTERPPFVAKVVVKECMLPSIRRNSPRPTSFIAQERNKWIAKESTERNGRGRRRGGLRGRKRKDKDEKQLAFLRHHRASLLSLLLHRRRFRRRCRRCWRERRRHQRRRHIRSHSALIYVPSCSWVARSWTVSSRWYAYARVHAHAHAHAFGSRRIWVTPVGCRSANNTWLP